MRRVPLFGIATLALVGSSLGYAFVASPAPAAAPALQPAAPPAAPPARMSTRFVISAGTGKILHTDGPEVPGKLFFTSTVNMAKAASAMLGNEPSTTGLLETDAGGKAYIFFDNLNQWRIGDDPTGAVSTLFTGQIDGKGGFMMAGKHALSATWIFLSGKVTFAKGTLNPTKIVGKLMATSELSEHYGSGTFTAILAP